MLNIASAVARCRSLTSTVPVLLAIGLIPAISVAQTPPSSESEGAATDDQAGTKKSAGSATESSDTAAADDADKARAPKRRKKKPAVVKAAEEEAAPSETPAAQPGAEPTEAEEKAEAARWVGRDAALRETGTLSGGTGLLHMQHAESGEVGQMRLGFTVEGFKAGFLCTSTFGCPAMTSNGTAVKGDSMAHWGGTLSLGGTLAGFGRGRLEGYISTSAYANSDDANRPALLQVMGDTTFGLKYVAPVGAKLVHLGAMAEVMLVNGTGSVGLNGGATSARFGGLLTIDFRDLENPLPMRLSTSLAYTVDNTGKVLQDTENTIGGPVTRIERFGLGVNRVDHVDIHLGAELLLVDERVRPFMEYSILAPSNRGGDQYRCHINNISGDLCLANDTVVPTNLTIGGRFYPWKEGFSVTAAFDIGVTGVANFIEELSPIPPWMFYLGAGWAMDTQTRPPVVRTKIIEKKVEAPLVIHHIKGFVHEKDKADGVANAIVAYDGRTDLTSLVSGADGHFTSQDVLEGTYTLNVKADGFHEGKCEVTITKEATEAPLDCALEALPRVGTIVGHLRDADTNAPLASISVHLIDGQKKDHALTTDSTGAYRFENILPGNAQFSVTAPGYLAMVGPTEIKVRQEVTSDITLRAKPKTSQVKVEAKEVTIKQQIQFALDSAVILPESFGLLSEIADTFIRETRIRKVEVQGHTDNSGTPEHNKVLSEQRAEAVRVWLQQHGVGGDRLVSQGYGQEKPVAANVTPALRAKNRRVQFIILEQDPATPAAPAAK